MQGYTPEQRKAYADHFCEMVREWIERRDSEFRFEMERGVEWCHDVASGERRPRANSTITFTLEVNGGAQPSEGPPIVPTPTVFRGH